MTVAPCASAFGTPISFNFLQQQQQQQQQQTVFQNQQHIINTVQFNSTNPNILLGQNTQVIQPQQVKQKDTTFTKIFVGGLPYHTTDESLAQFFQKFGTIEEAVVINDRQSGKSRGYGFVI